MPRLETKQQSSFTDATDHTDPMPDWSDLGEESKSETPPSSTQEHQYPTWGVLNPTFGDYAEQHHHPAHRATGIATPVATPPYMPYGGHSVGHMASPSPSVMRRVSHSDVTAAHPASDQHSDRSDSYFIQHEQITPANGSSSTQSQRVPSVSQSLPGTASGDAAPVSQPQPSQAQ